MVNYIYRFEKVLTIREQEKNETEIAYKESVRSFEEIANRLYELLKKKEDLIDFQQERLAVGSSIEEIHHYARFIDSLEKNNCRCTTEGGASTFKNELVRRKTVRKKLGST